MIKLLSIQEKLLLKSLKTGYIFLCLLSLNSCEKLLFINEGETVEKSLYFDYFSQLSFYDIFDVELKTDTIFSVKLRTDEKFLELISIHEDSGEIVFRDNNFSRRFPDYPRPKLTIGFPRLDGKIYTRSPIKLTNKDTLKLENLRLILLGKTGEFDLTMDVNYFLMVNGSDNFDFYLFRGKAKNAYIWPRGSSQVDASGLICRDCKVYNNSIGDCYVNVTHKLEARLNTIGDVIYIGNPEEIVKTEESGSGRLRRSD